MLAVEHLTPAQQRAAEMIQGWLAEPASQRRPWYYLGGYAGTGKTTLARHLAPPASLFAAFTGKAAHVMQKAGCEGATTIHRLAYTALQKSHARLDDAERRLVAAEADPATQPEAVWTLKQEVAKEKRVLRSPSWALAAGSPIQSAPLLVVDEVSMVGERLAQDLLSFKTPILVLGDPAQLPPVAGAGYFTRGEPDVLLTEVHRQAAESPVLALATAIRAGAEWPPRHRDAFLAPKASVTTTDLLAYSQVVCGRNATRRRLNGKMRAMLGFKSPTPVPGDKLICLRNNHDLGILNGSMWQVVEAGPRVEDLVVLTLVPDDDPQAPPLVLAAHAAHFVGEEIDPRRRLDYQEFDYGYAVTCHKAQGSAWPSVAVVDESDCFRLDARRWLYTAVTRAAERVVVIR